jgi:hypothetical protein
MFLEDGDGVEPEAFEDARAEGFDEDVGAGEEVEEEGVRGLVAEVDVDGGFAAGELVRAEGFGAVDAQDGGAVVC